MTATVEDIGELRDAMRKCHLKHTEALEAQRALCHLTSKFQGLIDPSVSWKHNDISQGVIKYLEDMDEICEERIKRVRVLTRILLQCNR